MESDKGKLFIGGISWDTNEERLRDYFSNYGEVVEAVIMKDRNTGRARGFGFVVFADPAVAEHVVLEKHKIDGRVVEAKKAVPRDDQHMLNRTYNSMHGSPGPMRTKKIFVGGLPSTITESEFKKYFEQFGTITDVVVMYDHNTQRPRGFGFITYDSEDAVGKVLLRMFHELNGKLVEVKRAVPKELSPSPTVRSPIGGYSYGLNRISSFLGSYGQGYNPSSIGGLGMAIGSGFGPISSPRSGLPTFGHTGYGMRMNLESGLRPSYTENMNYNDGLGYGRDLSPYYGGNPSRYNNLVGYGSGNSGVDSVFGSALARNLWGNGSLNHDRNSTGSGGFLGSGSGSLSGFGSNGVNWGSATTSMSAQSGRSGSGPSGYGNANLGYGSDDHNFGLGGSNYGRSTDTGGAHLSYTSTSSPLEGAYSDLYGGSSDPTWLSASLKLDDSGPFSYGIGSAASDAGNKGSAGYIGSYNVINRPNRDN